MQGSCPWFDRVAQLLRVRIIIRVRAIVKVRIRVKMRQLFRSRVIDALNFSQVSLKGIWSWCLFLYYFSITGNVEGYMIRDRVRHGVKLRL